jgi:hypothetical protein
MHERFSQRIEEGLASLARRIDNSKAHLDRGVLERQVGRLLQKNSRAAARYSISITEDRDVPAGVKLKWTRRPEWDDWARTSEGAYILSAPFQPGWRQRRHERRWPRLGTSLRG